jgi:hypothetical protein
VAASYRDVSKTDESWDEGSLASTEPAASEASFSNASQSTTGLSPVLSKRSIFDSGEDAGGGGNKTMRRGEKDGEKGETGNLDDANALLLMMRGK